MRNIEIRKAKLKDLKEILKLNLLLLEKENKEFDSVVNCGWTAARGKKYFKERIEKSGCTFVAVVDENVVGYLTGGLIREEIFRFKIKMAELETMFVMDNFRGIGIGKGLFKAFERWSRSKKMNRLRVLVSLNNVQALEFYRKKGFKDQDMVLEMEVD